MPITYKGHTTLKTHKHIFKSGKNLHKSHCDVKTGAMQRCNEPNPNWEAIKKTIR